MSPSLDAAAAQLPTTAGVYLFKDRRGGVLYVGKAINLRLRVRQYLSGHDGRMMVPHLVRQAHDIEVVVTGTEKEALLLENTLIKKHRPRFNVRLRDDSNYLHLRLDLSKPWPRYELVRQIDDDGVRVFGPYASAQKARETLAFLQRVFPLRTCSDAVLRSRTRPCLLHQMGRCSAPCVDLVTPEAYQQIAVDSTSLLQGHTRPVVRALEKRMHARAEALEFEEAARLRDLIASIRATVERQQVIDPRLSDRDVWGLHRDGNSVAIAVLPVREGVLTEPQVRVVHDVIEDDDELLSSAINAAYPEGVPIPDEILVPLVPRSASALEDLLSERRGKRVQLHEPVRGSKVDMVKMANDNARVRLAAQTDAGARRREALQQLAELVGLDEPPHRIECFDNSHLGGTDPVAAMAVFLDGQPARQEYRRYKVKTAAGDDDYAAMHEILTRRFRRGLESGELPDLLVVDGGKGQLGVALAVLEDLGLDQQKVIGLSKPRTEHARGDRHATDKIVLPGEKEPRRLPASHGGLRLLQHLRDETHRSAVQFQRRTRSKTTLASALEGLPGVGPARRKALLTHLGSIAAVADATVEQLVTVPGVGQQLAEQIHAAFHPEEREPAPLNEVDHDEP
jgi:excinuclease ABC subunit C